MAADDQLNLAQAGTLPPEVYQQQQELNRRQQFANLLMQQNQQPQGQMVSGRYVAPSFFQNLQPVANMLTGAYLAKQGDTEAAKLAQKIREGKSASEEKIINLMTPQPAIPGQAAVIPQGQTLRDDNGMLTYGAKEGTPGQAATTPDYAAALREIRTNPYGVGKDYVPTILKQLAPEETSDYKNFLKVKQEFDAKGIPITFNQYQDMEANRKRPVTNVSVNTGQRGFENAMKLGEAFKQEPIYKTHQVINQAYNQINNALDKGNAAGDLTAAIKINKLLDPDSIVRESEVATVANATGLIDKLSNYASQVAKGTRLNPEQRKEYRQLAKDFYRISGEQYNETRNKYAEMGKSNKIEGVDTMLGQPWKAPTTAPTVTKNMEDANKILGIPSIGGQ